MLNNYKPEWELPGNATTATPSSNSISPAENVSFLQATGCQIRCLKGANDSFLDKSHVLILDLKESTRHIVP